MLRVVRSLRTFAAQTQHLKVGSISPSDFSGMPRMRSMRLARASLHVRRLVPVLVMPSSRSIESSPPSSPSHLDGFLGERLHRPFLSDPEDSSPWNGEPRRPCRGLWGRQLPFGVAKLKAGSMTRHRPPKVARPLTTRGSLLGQSPLQNVLYNHSTTGWINGSYLTREKDKKFY